MFEFESSQGHLLSKKLPWAHCYVLVGPRDQSRVGIKQAKRISTSGVFAFTNQCRPNTSIDLLHVVYSSHFLGYYSDMII